MKIICMLTAICLAKIGIGTRDSYRGLCEDTAGLRTGDAGIRHGCLGSRVARSVDGDWRGLRGAGIMQGQRRRPSAVRHERGTDMAHMGVPGVEDVARLAGWLRSNGLPDAV